MLCTKEYYFVKGIDVLEVEWKLKAITMEILLTWGHKLVELSVKKRRMWFGAWEENRFILVN